ncbi:uncharacterized protein PFL1_06797 [Pseudozyma flocculosa PF-1]|uniref:SGNH hydrolase-type esterase domain-containing protein n=2 Tax=Pseudozyma flocculosa TaxID=84751 RepID=A0A5C3FFA3_9BASI|nr:uncharacterized protein PFL1_06797 [Pseudozyma flocculosa PF-1]EPQ25660.1 hypothetical protein PFL1_06797 [Pseudozyma flocculosa PF-1]SPO42069.1 uncharacterized protein PSFLO_07552 [Pseudozyma flocculosa]
MPPHCLVPHNLTIASMGSSFASGPGLQPVANAEAGRSYSNYANLLAQRLPGSHLVDLAVSGSTLANMLDTPQVTPTKATFAPQLDGVPANADVVTILGGGNDLSISSQLIYEAAPPVAKAGVVPAAPSASGAEVERRFLALVDAVHSRAPKAKIFLVEYVQVVGKETVPQRDILLDETRIGYYEERQQLLSDIYHRVAEKRSGVVDLVPMYRDSRHHVLGSAQPWVTGFTDQTIAENRAPFHPDYAAHRAIADKLYGDLLGPQCRSRY